jgi:hypothetical protein
VATPQCAALAGGILGEKGEKIVMCLCGVCYGYFDREKGAKREKRAKKSTFLSRFSF